MHKSFTKKLDYEKGKLKSKLAKPGYRERFAEEGSSFDRGGSPHKYITLADAVKVTPAVNKILRDDKSRAIEIYNQRIKNMMVKIGQFHFKFKFEVTEFAEANRISLEEASRLLPTVAKDAQEYLRITLNRARKAPLERRPVLSLRFRTFLPTAELVDWSKIYKRVVICPMNEELPRDTGLHG